MAEARQTAAVWPEPEIKRLYRKIARLGKRAQTHAHEEGQCYKHIAYLYKEIYKLEQALQKQCS